MKKAKQKGFEKKIKENENSVRKQYSECKKTEKIVKCSKLLKI